MTKQQLWGGRFKKELDQIAKDFSFSLDVDFELLPYDIEVNKVQALALEKAGVLTKKERVKIHASLESIAQNSDKILSQDNPDEDIHSLVERLVIEDIGDLGKKMHTGKSRNDQVATDVRMYVKDAIHDINDLMMLNLKSLYHFSEKHKATLFPGFTHLQVAQPIVLGHHVLAYFEKLKRDQNRFADAFDRTDFCPLGSAAMAGSNYPVDRLFICNELGFSDITVNSMDAVSDRDFILDTIYACSMVTLHLSQFCEELIFWSSSVVGFITIGDEFTTGSSIMPQKKNPDIAELIRGQAGPVAAQLFALHEMIKGLPLTYNRDLQDDKKCLFQAIQITKSVLSCFYRMLDTIEINQENINKAMNTGHILATEIADYLVQKGLPFREAHEVVGTLVQMSEEKGCQVHELDLTDMKSVSEIIESDVQSILSLKAAVNNKQVIGGTAFDQVETQLNRIKEEFKW